MPWSTIRTQRRRWWRRKPPGVINIIWSLHSIRAKGTFISSAKECPNISILSVHCSISQSSLKRSIDRLLLTIEGPRFHSPIDLMYWPISIPMKTWKFGSLDPLLLFGLNYSFRHDKILIVLDRYWTMSSLIVPIVLCSVIGRESPIVANWRKLLLYCCANSFDHSLVLIVMKSNRMRSDYPSFEHWQWMSFDIQMKDFVE